MEISGIIDTLPLEFRGSQPVSSVFLGAWYELTMQSQRLAMEKIIMKLMDGRQLASEITYLACFQDVTLMSVADLISLPDLPHPRVNKCLIALVGRKLVTKHSEGVSCQERGMTTPNTQGRTEYRWVGV
jgi:DASH complex subunit DAM1